MKNYQDYTKPATWEDVIRVVELLKKYKAKFMLVGGYALKAYGNERQTMDIDIAVDISPENSEKWIFALAELPDGVTKELIGEKDPFDGDYLHAIRINDEITLDIMPSVAGISFEELYKDIYIVNIKDVEIPILSPRGIYKTKKNSLREKDKMDILFIEKVLNEDEDLNNENGPSM